ncbi:hypothetical protein ES705_48543 [subsurface metagenome]
MYIHPMILLIPLKALLISVLVQMGGHLAARHEKEQVLP